MRSDKPEYFSLRRSRRLILATVLGHIVALVGLALWLGLSVYLVLAALAVGHSALRALGRPWPVCLKQKLGGAWELRWSDGSRQISRISTGRIIPGVISITCTGGFSGSLLLLPDAFCDQDHKRLRRVLRNRVGSTA